MQKMSNAAGLRGILVAAALIALAHGLLMKKIYPVHAGRPHDGLPHPSFFEQQQRSKADEIKEMFEFAKTPTNVAGCSSMVDDFDFYSGAKTPTECATASPTVPRASYMSSAVINSYPEENLMNGGTQDGIGAFEPLGFGGSEL